MLPNLGLQRNSLLPLDAGPAPALVDTPSTPELSPEQVSFDDLKPSTPKPRWQGRKPFGQTDTTTTVPTPVRPPQLEDLYTTWQKQPTPANMSAIVTHLEPVIQRAIKTYAPNASSRLVYGRARVLAMKAVRTYDPSAGAKLETYVMSQLQGLRRYATAASTATKESERHRSEYYALREAETEFYEEYGREPSDAELADKLGISIRKINLIRKYGVKEIGTELAEGAPDEEGESGGVGMMEVDPEDIWIDYVYHDLSPTDQKIMDWKLGRHGQPVLSNAEIARRLGISPSAVSQRSARIMQKLEEGLALAESGVLPTEGIHYA